MKSLQILNSEIVLVLRLELACYNDFLSQLILFTLKLPRLVFVGGKDNGFQREW